MANSILKLKVESEEYDAKLKKAAEGIRHLADVAHKGGGELTGLEKAELDYIKALGDMETKSRTAAGSTRELENAFKELTVIYNNLSDVEKADEGGKALAASLEKLKQRTIDSKSQLDAATKSLQSNESAGQSNSSALEQLASKFTINIDALKLFNIGLQALDAALGVAKDAFFSSETNVDEWGRTVESAKGIYEGFLQSINTGDISGFLNNINQITAAAREAYNALDELGTRQTILNPERAKLQARSTELKATIRREGADSAAGKAAAAELKALEKPLTEAWKTESKLNRDAFTALVKERLAEGGINLNQKSFNAFMKTFSSDAAFQNLRRNARGSVTTEMTGNAYNPNAAMTRRTVDTRNTEQKLLDLFTDEWRQANSGYLTAAYNAQGSAASTMLGDARYLKGGKGGSGSKVITEEKDDFTEIIGLIGNAEERVRDLQKQIKEAPDETTISILRDQLKDAQQELDRLNGKTAKTVTWEQGLSGFNEQTISAWTSMIKSQLAKEDIGSALYSSLMDNMSDMSRLTTTVQDAIKLGLDIPQDSVQEMFEQVFDQNNLPADMYNDMIQKFIDDFKERTGQDLKVGENGSLSAGKEDKKGEDGLRKVSDVFSKLGGGLNQVNSGLQQLGVQMPKEVDELIGTINAVGSVISGIQTVISLFGNGAMAANTAAVIANTAAMVVNSGVSILPYAGGGVVHAADGWVGGNRYSGDQIPAMLNSGEVVLNRAQVGNLAAQLEGGDFGNMQLEATIYGEDIKLALNNNGKRTQKGEFVQSRRRY